MTSPDVQKFLDHMLVLHPRAIDLSLGRMVALLEKLGNPQDHLPPVIHVAGTNGKGSSAAFLKAILGAAGYRVHCYTSPHLVRFNERICLDGVDVADDVLIDTLREILRVNDVDPITFFEITTAAALMLFARHPADVLVLEVGLGGRLDATNVVSSPAVCLITPISIDHQEFLGDSLTKIANEKAGIIKTAPVVVSAQLPEVFQVLEQVARTRMAPLYAYGHHWRYSEREDGFTYHGAGEWAAIDLPIPGLFGAHQRLNAAAVVACLEQLSAVLPVGVDDLRAGIAKAIWPARMQRLTVGPMIDMLPEGWELWLDGGHNPAGGKVFAAMLAQWRNAEPDRKIYLIIGMSANKDLTGYASHLVGLVAGAYTVTIPDHASFAADAAAMVLKESGIVASIATSPADALQKIIKDDAKGARVVIAGSLYLAGSVLADHH